MAQNDMQKMVKRWRKKLRHLSSSADLNDRDTFLIELRLLALSFNKMESKMMTEESEGAVQKSLFE
jgi:hypothetical protein